MLNNEEYIRLMTEMPRVIDTEKEYERLLKEARSLMAMSENLTAEQAEVLQLLAILIEQYEDEHYQLQAATPHEILNELMLVRGLKQKDLLEIFGSSGFNTARDTIVEVPKTRFLGETGFLIFAYPSSIALGFTSEVVNGKRGISKTQAKALGDFFHVSPALFL